MSETKKDKTQGKIDQIELTLSQKCKIHPSYNCDLLNLLANSAENVRICFECVKRQNIHFNQVISLRSLLESTESTVLPSFVPFDKETIEENILRLEDNPGQYFDQINEYFDQIQQQITSLIKQVREKAKKHIETLLIKKSQALQTYNTLAQKDVMKEIFFESNDNNNQAIFEQLKLRFIQASQNSSILQPPLDGYLAYLKRFQIKEAEEIRLKIVELIKSIDFFPPSCSILDNIQFIPTPGYNNSSNNFISERTEQGHLKFCSVIDGNSRRQGYLNFILNPSVKYVLKFDICQKSNNSPDFDIGLLPGNNKDKDPLGQFKMSYCENGFNGGVTKRVKGGVVWSGSDGRNVQRQLELRIHLNERIFKIGDYPSYNRAVELNNPQSIDLNQSYYLGISTCFLNDCITLMQVKEVKEFDGQM